MFAEALSHVQLQISLCVLLFASSTASPLSMHSIQEVPLSSRRLPCRHGDVLVTNVTPGRQGQELSPRTVSVQLFDLPTGGRSGNKSEVWEGGSQR